MSFSQHDLHHNQVDRRYRAKVVIILAVSCLGFWGVVGFFAFRAL